MGYVVLEPSFHDSKIERELKQSFARGLRV